MVSSTKIGQKCIIVGCENRSGVQGNGVSFYPVACRGNKVYPRWTKLMPLSGDRHERICSQHFVNNDFIENTRQKLKNVAVPTVKLEDGKIQRGKECCVPKCKSNKTKRGLQHFPTLKSVRKKWKKALGMHEAEDTTGLSICNRHFLTTDFVKVTSRYLKATAIPSRKLTRLVKLPRRVLVHLDSPTCLKDHNYSIYACKPRSNRICFVEGCRSKSEGNIKLHKFPVAQDPRYKEWIRILKCSKLPTRNSTVCSLHFRKTDYIGGGPRLKLVAVPSKRIPDAPMDSSTTTDSFDEEGPAHRSTSQLQQQQSEILVPRDIILDHQITNEVNNSHLLNTASSYDDNQSKFVAGHSAVKNGLDESPVPERPHVNNPPSAPVVEQSLLLDVSQLSISGTPLASSSAKKMPVMKEVFQTTARMNLFDNSNNQNSAITNSDVGNSTKTKFGMFIF